MKEILPKRPDGLFDVDGTFLIFLDDFKDPKNPFKDKLDPLSRLIEDMGNIFNNIDFYIVELPSDEDTDD